MLYSIKSAGELPFVAGNGKFAYISAAAFERFFDDDEAASADADAPPPLMALKLTTIPGDLVRYVAVAGAADGIDDYDIYLPYSIYQELTATSRFPPKVTATVAYDLERATKIVLKPLDNAIYHSEMRDLLEEEMMDFPLLQKHTQFTIHLSKLGDYPVDIWVEDIEPAEVVRLGGEVVVDFSEPLEEFVAEPVAVPAAVRAPTPIPPPIDEPVSAGPFAGMSFPLDNAFNVPVPPQPQSKPVLPTAEQAAQMRAARLARLGGNSSTAATSSQAI
jgi:hypothetical protein